MKQIKPIFETKKKIEVFLNLFSLHLKMQPEWIWEIINQEEKCVGKMSYRVEEKEIAGFYGNFKMQFNYNSFLVKANMECSPWVEKIEFTMKNKWNTFKGEAQISHAFFKEDKRKDKKMNLVLDWLSLDVIKTDSITEGIFIDRRKVIYWNTMRELKISIGEEIEAPFHLTLETHIGDGKKSIPFHSVELDPSEQEIRYVGIKKDNSSIFVSKEIEEGNMYNQFKEAIEKYCPEIYDWLEFIIATYDVAGLAIIEESIKKLFLNKMECEELDCLINENLKRKLQKVKNR